MFGLIFRGRCFDLRQRRNQEFECMRYPFGREGLLSQLVWPELENEAWKDTGSPKRVLWYFLNKGVNRKLPSQAAWPKLENETWTGPGSPTPPRSGCGVF